MKRGTPNHSKTRRLAKTLDVPQSHAVGLLECLWHWAAQERPAGDIGRCDDELIADMLYWPEEDAGRLIEALVRCKWLDERRDSRLIIHDWPKHCEDAVHRSLARDVAFFADGTKPFCVRWDHKERAQVERAYKKKYGGRPDAPGKGRAGPDRGEKRSLPG